MSAQPRNWPCGWAEIVSMAASAGLLVSLIAPAPTDLRFLLAVVFIAFGPGTAILVVLGGHSVARLEVGLIVALGLGVTALVAESLLWVGAFDPRPEVALAAVAVFATVAMTSWRSGPRTGTAIGRDGRSRTVDPGPDEPLTESQSTAATGTVEEG